MNKLQTEDLLVQILIQLIIIVLAARAAGAVAARMRQPRAVGEILAGLALGPSLLGALAPDLAGAIFTQEAGQPLMVLSQLGLLLLMFQIGADFEFGQLRTPQNRRVVTFVTIASVVAPLLAGFAMGQWTAPILAPGVDPLIYSLFMAIAMAITAVPILGRILREYGLTRSETGVIAIAAAAGNDVVGWMLLAGVAALATQSFEAAAAFWRLAGLCALLAMLWFVGRPLAQRLLERFPVTGDAVPTPLMAIVLAAIFAAGVATESLGVFTIFGGFLLGLLFHPHHNFVSAWRAQIGQFVLVFFLPIFFTYTGLRTNILGLDSFSDWAWCAGLFAVAVATKIAPVMLAARLAGMDSSRAATLGVLMNTRALMELVVLNIGLSLGFIPQDVFTMLVIMAVGTTIMTGPLLRVLLTAQGHAIPERIEA